MRSFWVLTTLFDPGFGHLSISLFFKPELIHVPDPYLNKMLLQFIKIQIYLLQFCVHTDVGVEGFKCIVINS